MDRTLLELLLPLVNDRDAMEALEAYAQHRIATHHRTLEAATDMVTISQAQGAITELRRFAKLRDEANGRSKELR